MVEINIVSVFYLLTLLELLWFVVVSALIDSMDPCFYAILASIMLSALLVSHRFAVKAGLVFLLAVYTGYLLVGLLLRQVTLILPMYVLIGLLVTYGSIILLVNAWNYRNKKHRAKTSNIGGELLCREEDLPCRVMRFLNIDRFISGGLISMFVLGLISSFTILPCSAQLYVLFHIVTREYGFATWVALTFFYVAVFISPALILYLMFITASRSKKVINILVEHEELFKIAGAILMITVALYLYVIHYEPWV